MRLKFLVGVLVFLIVVNLATIGTFLYIHFTKPDSAVPFRSPWMVKSSAPARAPRLRHLPSERRRELMGLLKEFHDETSALRARMNELENETFDLMQLDVIPAAPVDSLLREISAARLEISRVAVQKLIKAKTILPSEEQRMFFDAIQEARPHRFPHGPGDGTPGQRGRRTQRDSL